MPKYATTILFIFSILLSNAQTIRVSGNIIDANTGEKLPNASIRNIDNIQNGLISNEYGYFSINISGQTSFQFSFAGYQSEVLKFGILSKDTFVIVKLKETILETVEINASNHDNTYERRTQMSQIDLSIKVIKAIPSLGGEADPLKALTLMPGAKFGNEGSAGLYVRGGTPDQNLILLDDAIVYNPAHLFGFISVFNTDALKKVELLKGGVPARYGGRAGSVTNILMREGNNQKKTREFGIGLLSSKLLIEGPFKSDKTSYLFSARTSYYDLPNIFQTIGYLKSKSGELLTYRFYDINAKVNHAINEKEHIFVSFYHGNDMYNVYSKNIGQKDKLGLNWNNTTLTTRYTKILSPKLFFKSTFNLSRYSFNILTTSEVSTNIKRKIKNTSTIFDIAAKGQYDYFPNDVHHIKMGVEATQHFYNPGRINISENSQTVVSLTHNAGLFETAVYIEDEIKPTDRFSTQVGLRLSSAISTNKSYFFPEPRLALRWQMTEKSALKASYNLMAQYSHLLTSNSVGLANDVWVPANKYVPPQYVHQFAVGWGYSLDEGNIELSLEAYYKSLKNQIDFQEGANVTLNLSKNWWELIEKNGIGKAYGTEFLIQKKSGKWQGWIGYTLSWNFRQFDNINKGKIFPFRYDRRHEFSIVNIWKRPSGWDFSATWVYATGNAATVVVARHNPPLGSALNIPESEIIVLSERNAYRMPNFHRLDMGWQKKSLNKKGREKTWGFGAYNAYNRLNPFYITLGEVSVGQSFEYQLIQKSLLPIVPYISYSLKW
jgi:hypothetical protein